MRKKQTSAINATDRVYLRTDEAAEYLGVSKRTFRTWAQNRLVASIRPTGRVVLFRKADLDAAMDRFRVRAVGEGIADIQGRFGMGQKP